MLGNSGDILVVIIREQGAPEIWWLEAISRNGEDNPAQQRSIQPKMSLVLLLRNPSLEVRPLLSLS